MPMTNMLRGRGGKYLLCGAELESGGCHGDREVRKGARGGTLCSISHTLTQTKCGHAYQR